MFCDLCFWFIFKANYKEHTGRNLASTPALALAQMRHYAGIRQVNNKFFIDESIDMNNNRCQ